MFEGRVEVWDRKGGLVRRGRRRKLKRKRDGNVRVKGTESLSQNLFLMIQAASFVSPFFL